MGEQTNRHASDTEGIKQYYRERAGTQAYTTSPDFNLREIEIEYLQRWLGDGLDVLDVGCGNGYSTICHASKFRSRFTGVDFVPEMVEAAKTIVSAHQLAGEVGFLVGDVANLDFPPERFDVVISERCLLNLPNKEAQWLALNEISRVLRPGGRYLMLEGTLQGLARLNDVRAIFGLPPIPAAHSGYNWFSNKFDEDEMRDVADHLFARLEATQRFGMYYFISRVLHPLLVAPQQPRYDALINRLARQICTHFPNFEDLGHLALWVFQK